jgi:ribosomal-protein-alanine N-acetyltransferase
MALPFIQTPRLALVPFAADDLDELYTLWIDANVRRYLWDDVVITRERAASELASALATAESDGIGYWSVREAADAPIIGDCGFRFVEGSREVELMYCLLPACWGRGLAFEGCQAALQYLWTVTPFDRVVARADIPNAASIRLMERLGMRYESSDGVLLKFVMGRPPSVY